MSSLIKGFAKILSFQIISIYQALFYFLCVCAQVSVRVCVHSSVCMDVRTCIQVCARGKTKGLSNFHLELNPLKFLLEFFYVPCFFRTLAIKALPNFLSFLDLIKFSLSVISPETFSTSNFLMLVRLFMFCCPLFLLPLISTVSIKLFKPSFLIMYPIIFNS